MLKPSFKTARMLFLALCCLLALNIVVVGAQDATQEPAPPATVESAPAEATAPPEVIPPVETEVVTPAATETAAPPVVETVETTVTVSPTSEVVIIGTPLPAEPPLQLLVRETLDNGDLSPWLLGEGWSLVPGGSGQMLQVSSSNAPAQLLKGDFLNVVVQAEVFVQAGAAQITVRQSDVGNYTATLDASGLVRLFRSSELMQSFQGAASAAGQANTLRLSAIDGVVRVAVNNSEVIAVFDALALPPGKVSVSADFTLSADGSPIPENTLRINDVFLWVKADESALYPAPTAMSAPVTQVTLVPTEATQEPEIASPAPEIVITSEAAPIIETVEAEIPGTFEDKEFSAFPAPSAEQIAQVGPLPNDDFGAAIVIPSSNPLNAYASSEDTTSATLQVGEEIPSCDYNISNTIWFSFTPTFTANYTLSTATSAFDTVLAIYTGTTVDNLTLVGCNDDATAATFTSLLTRSLQAGTNYHIQLGGYNGRYGQYALSVVQMGLPVPTLLPILKAPLDNTLTNNIAVPLPALEWNTVAGAHHYEVQIDSDKLFGTPDQQYNQISGLTYTVNPSLPMLLTTPTTYYWRVRALNISNQPGPWSASRRFIVDTAPPPIPKQALPANNMLFTVLTPTFTWSTPLGTAVGYRLDIDDAAPDGTCDFRTPFLENVSATAAKYVSAILPQGNYCWRVQSLDPAGNASAESGIRAFKIFIGSTPADNTRLLTVGTALDISVAFKWVAVAGATGYSINLFDETCSTPRPGFPVLVAPSITKTILVPHGEHCWNVRAQGVETVAPFGFRMLTVSPPGSLAPALTTPTLNQSIGDNTPEFTWSATASTLGAPFTYDLQIDNSGCLFPSPEINRLELGTSYTHFAPLLDGAYCWRVRTVNTYGVVGPWSAGRAFTLDTVIPAAPTLVTPANNALVPYLRPTFTWTAAVGSGSTSYRLDVDDDPELDGSCDFTSLVITDQVFTKAPFVIPPTTAPLLQGGYCWRVQALDAAGNLSDESASRAFKVFIGTAPADRQVHTPLGTATTYNVLFKWEKVVGATGYILTLFDATCAGTGTPHSLAASVLSKSLSIARGTHCWKVQALGIDAGVPPTFATVLVSPKGPAAPAPTKPTVNQIINDNTPEFTWNATTSTTNSPYTYEIQLDNSGCLFPSPDMNAFGLGLSYTPTTPLPDGVYCWRARSANTYGGYGAWGAARSFTLDTAAPAAPTLSLPADKALLLTLRPSFNWVAALKSGSTSYRLDVANDPELDGTCDFTNLAVTNQIVTKVPYSPLAPAAPLPQGSYCWRVRAVDPAGNEGTDSLVRSFKIFIGKAPLDNALLYTVGAAATVTVPFKWQPVPGATGYRLKLFDETCVTERFNFEGGTVSADRGASVQRNTPVPPGVYCWKVQALGMDPGVPTTFRKLTVSPRPSVAPALALPIVNAVTPDNTPEFTWNTVPAPAGMTFTYDLQVDNSGCAFPSPEVNKTGLGLSHTPTIPLADGLYCWKVRAINNVGVIGVWSATRALTVDTSGTLPPTLKAPLDNASLSAPTPAFSWNRMVGAASYQLQLKTADTACEAMDVPLIPVPAPKGAVLPPTVGFTPSSPLLNKTYFWCVRAIDPVGNPSPWSVRRAVKIVSTATAVSILNRFTTSPVKLSWGPISWVAPSGYYQVQVDNNINFLSAEYQSSNLVAGTQTLDVPVAAPLTNGTWYWRVRACKANGTCGAWSGIGIFTIES